MGRAFKTEEGQAIVLNRYKEILAQWPVANKQYRVQTSIGSTFIIESGDKGKPPLLLLHGSVSNSFTWFSDVIELSKKYNVFTIDIIGDAGLSESVRPNYKSGAYEQWLTEVLTELRLDSCYMAGISLGGWMALRFSIYYPERVKGLFLISSGGLAKVNPLFLWKVLFYTLTGRRQKILVLVNGGKPPTETPSLKTALEYTALISEHFRPRTETLPVFSSKELSRLSMPVKVVFGEKDCLFPAEKGIQLLVQSVPHAEVLLLPDTGHVVVNQAKRMSDFFGYHG